MNARRLIKLLIVTLFVAALPGLTVALAQDDAPVKGAPAGPGMTREQATAAADVQPGFVPQVNESEPNDSMGQATWFDFFPPLSAAKFEGRMDYVGDVDYFEFCPGSDDVFAAAINAELFGSSLDSQLFLFDDGGNQVASNDDSRDLDSYLEYATGNTDCFYLVVDDYNNGGAGPNYWYELYVWRVKPGAEEPNNSKAKAREMAFGEIITWPVIGKNGDMDWYKFEGKKGDHVEVFIDTTGIHGNLDTKAALTGDGVNQTCNQTNNPTPNRSCYLGATLPKTGTYYVSVADGRGVGGPAKRYWLDISFYRFEEQHNTKATAQPIEYGQSVRSTNRPGDETDWYKFYGSRDDMVTVLGANGVITVEDQNGNMLVESHPLFDPNTFTLELWQDGWYYVNVSAFCSGAAWYCFGYNEVYELTVGPLMLLGVSTNGTVGNLQYQMGDILAYFPDSDSYAMYFDASDVGVKQNLGDFVPVSHDWRDDDNVLHTYGGLAMVFRGTAKLPGLGAVPPQDIVVFHSSSYGEDTRGWFSLYLDGSLIGLTTAGEAIDALGVNWNYDPGYGLVFSTTGRATVTGSSTSVTADDEDLIECVPRIDLPVWEAWEHAYCGLFLDGSASGIPSSADIAAIDNFDEDRVYLTFSAPVTVNGVNYQRNDIAVCSLYDPCDWQPKYWNGNDHGMKGKSIDGLDNLWQVVYR